MSESVKKVRRIAIEYDDGNVDMIKNPNGLMVLVNEQNTFHKNFENNLDEDSTINVNVMPINCDANKTFQCVDAVLKLAWDLGMINGNESDGNE